MESYFKTFEKLRESIVTTDLIILIAAVWAFCLLVLTIAFKKSLSKSCKIALKKNQKISKHLIAYTNLFYSLFMTTITIFPLLGMLGTVFGLLGLDLSSGNMENIKNNFFIALTSTAWGIIFSVIFKLFHAVIATGVEDVLEKAKHMIEE